MLKDDSLAAIDKDLRDVVEFCVSSGLGSGQIARGASPLLAAARNSRRRAWMKRVVIVSVAFAVIAFLFQNVWTYRWICVLGKFVAVKVLPYWDWTPLYDEECILYNPYMAIDKLMEDDCKECEHYTEMVHFKNVSVQTVAEDYLFNNLPFIVTDASQEWKAFSDLNDISLKKLYTENEIMKSHDVCQYQNKEGQSLVDVFADRAHSFHTIWSNCHLPAIKAFRSYYQRPYFLPPMVESATENFVAFSSGLPEHTDEYTEDRKYLQYISLDDLTWFAQIRGSYFVQLRPKTPCDDTCKMFQFVLQEGQTMVITNIMWEWRFTPNDSSPTIAIGSTGTWDD